MKLLATIPSLCCPPGADPLPQQEREQLAARFKALADPARIGILNMLSAGDEVCVCTMTDELGLSQPTVSHHLRLLRDAGLRNLGKRGTSSYYTLPQEALDGPRSRFALP